MDELIALAQLRSDAPGPAVSTLAAIRAQLARAEITAESEPATGPTVAAAAVAVGFDGRGRRRPRRYVLAGVVGLAASIAVAFGAYALTGGGPGRGSAPLGAPSRPGSIGAPSRPGSSAPAPVAIPAHYSDAAQLLTIAAATATRAGDPGPGQFRYARVYARYAVDGDNQFSFSSEIDEYWQSSGPDSSVLDKRFFVGPTLSGRPNPTPPPTRGPAAKDVTWYLTVGSHPQGELWPDNLPCYCDPAPAQNPWAVNDPTAATLAQLPHDPAALRASLLAWATSDHRTLASYGKQFSVAELAFDSVGYQLDSGLAPAALRSALFEVIKTLPGITLTGPATNYAGQTGLGISVPQEGGTQRTMIFDRTGAYIGAKQVVVRRTLQWPLAPGTVVSWSAVQYAITGAPALPPGVPLPH